MAAALDGSAPLTPHASLSFALAASASCLSHARGWYQEKAEKKIIAEKKKVARRDPGHNPAVSSPQIIWNNVIVMTSLPHAPRP